MTPRPTPYPLTKKNGSILIRRMIKLLREHGVELPLKKAAIAVSGGSDSMALALLLCKYGRKIVAKENLLILHINHGWRGEESDGDEEYVREFANSMNVGLRIHQLSLKSKIKGKSPELVARNERKRIFQALWAEGLPVFTAHQSDDLAETLLWRLCLGKFDDYSKGILVQYKSEIRPLLSSTKAELQSFLKEEGLTWREDRTNHDGILLRSKMRKKLMPHLVEVFPEAIGKMADYSLKKQKEDSDS